MTTTKTTKAKTRNKPSQPAHINKQYNLKTTGFFWLLFLVSKLEATLYICKRKSNE